MANDWTVDFARNDPNAITPHHHAADQPESRWRRHLPQRPRPGCVYPNRRHQPLFHQPRWWPAGYGGADPGHRCVLPRPIGTAGCHRSGGGFGLGGRGFGGGSLPAINRHLRHRKPTPSAPPASAAPAATRSNSCSMPRPRPPGTIPSPMPSRSPARWRCRAPLIAWRWWGTTTGADAFYAIPMTQGQLASFILSRTDSSTSTLSVALLDSGGTLLSVGSAGAANYLQGINGFPRPGRWQLTICASAARRVRAIRCWPFAARSSMRSPTTRFPAPRNLSLAHQGRRWIPWQRGAGRLQTMIAARPAVSTDSRRRACGT